MVGSISGTGSYFVMYRYSFTNGTASEPVKQARAGRESGAAVQSADSSYMGFWSAKSADSRVNLVPPVHTVGREQENAVPDRFIRKGVDPAEYAVRMRIQYMEPGSLDTPEQAEALQGVRTVSETAEGEECKTCEQRRYQDGSDDMGVSFQTPTRIAPEAAGAAVRGHEQEHVTRERAKAERENRRVVSQSVTLHTDICPECGKVYISGGTTRTTTASRPEQEVRTEPEQAQGRSFSAVA